MSGSFRSQICTLGLATPLESCAHGPILSACQCVSVCACIRLRKSVCACVCLGRFIHPHHTHPDIFCPNYPEGFGFRNQSQTLRAPSVFHLISSLPGGDNRGSRSALGQGWWASHLGQQWEGKGANPLLATLPVTSSQCCHCRLS